MQVLQTEFNHTDERRTLTQLLTANIQQVNRYKIKKGATLGKHFHKQTREFFYILAGQICYNDILYLSKDSIFVVEPEEMHTLKCSTGVELMTFLSKPYTTDDPDTFKETK